MALPPVQERQVSPASQDQDKRALTPHPFLLRGLDSAGSVLRILHRAGGDAVQAAADVGHRQQEHFMVVEIMITRGPFGRPRWQDPLTPLRSFFSVLFVCCTDLSGLASFSP